MDIKVLHIDSNHSYCGINCNNLVCESQRFYIFKEEIEAKINGYQGIVSGVRLTQTFLDATNLQFIARVGAGLESIDCDMPSLRTLHLSPLRRQ
jgi:D-3-phosphoglycerate dehydrogenase